MSGTNKRDVRERGVCKRAARLLELAVGLPATVVVAACVALLAAASVVVTGYSQFSGNAGTITVLSEFGQSGPVRQLAVPAAVAACEMVAVLLMRDHIRRWDVRRTVVVCLTVAALVQLTWTAGFMTETYRFNDTLQIDEYARALNDGDMSKFVGVDEWDEPVRGWVPSYLIRVPYQAGMVWMFALVYRVFGNGNFSAIQCISMLSNLAAMALLIGVATEASRDGDGEADPMVTKLCSLACVTFLPFLMSATFVYSNALAFALVLAACYVSAIAWSRRSPVADALCSVSALAIMSVAVMLKQTFLLMGIVLVLCWVLYALRESKPALLLVALAMGWAFLHACDLPIWLLEQATGVRFGDGQPIFTNITLGLTWSPDGNAPGWYSGVAFDCYNKTDGSLAAQSAWCADYIRERMAEFAADPGYAFYFFRYKLASEWLDPSWQTCWFSGCAIADVPRNGILAKATLNTEVENTLLVAVLDGMQTVTYALAAVGFASSVREAREGMSIGRLLVVGTSLVGLLVYLLWEAQAMYTLPFVFLMLPMVARGVQVIYDCMARRRG